MPTAKQHVGEIVRLKKQATIYRLRLQGLTEAEIASRMNVSQQAISKSIVSERERLRLARDVAGNLMVDREAEELALVKREAWRGWKRSLREGEPGSTPHLATVIKASERIAKLYGLDAPPPSKDPETEAIGGDLEILEVVIDETEEADRLRDHHVVAVRSERIQPAVLKETPPDVAPTSKTPKPKSRSRRQAKATPKADKKAAGVRPAPEPHKRVRGRPRGRKD
jgi:transcriptional regulator with XRE-family HTH domain